MRSAGDIAFGVLLLAALSGLTVLVLPYAGALLAAAVIVVLVWPMHALVLRATGGRPRISTAISLVLLVLGLAGLVGLLAGLVVPELSRLTQDLSGALQPDNLDPVLDTSSLKRVDALVASVTGMKIELGRELSGAVRNAVVTVAGGLAGAVPALLQGTGQALLQSVVFVIALGTFLVSGPKVLRWARHMLPLDPSYSERLYEIFASFSRNVVLASLLGGLTQGVVAGVGYAIAGVERAALFSVVTAVVAVVPFVGTALVWVPLTALMLAQGRNGDALLIVIWNLTLTTSVDNLVKPLVVRGRTDLPPLLVFLGVFGGLHAMGLVGLLVGPMLVAMTMALLTIHEERKLAAQAPAGEVIAAPPG